MRLGLTRHFHECPECKSRSVRRSVRETLLEATLFRILRVAPYRCTRCERRFLDFRLSRSDSHAPSAATSPNPVGN